MGKIGANFDGEVFRKNHPMVIATNRNSAVLLPVQLRYDADGYEAGQTLAINSGDDVYEKYNSSGSSGTDTAKAVLFQEVREEDFSSSGDTVCAVAIFGGCTVYKDQLADWDSGALADVKGTEILDASGVTVIKF